MQEGGFTPFRPLTWIDQQVFQKAFDNIVSVGYTPYAVSTQVVNGVNYRFLCTKTLVVADPLKTIVIVDVFCPTSGSVYTKELSVTINE